MRLCDAAATATQNLSIFNVRQMHVFELKLVLCLNVEQNDVPAQVGLVGVVVISRKHNKELLVLATAGVRCCGLVALGQVVFKGGTGDGRIFLMIR